MEYDDISLEKETELERGTLSGHGGFGVVKKMKVNNIPMAMNAIIKLRHKEIGDIQSKVDIWQRLEKHPRHILRIVGTF